MAEDKHTPRSLDTESLKEVVIAAVEAARRPDPETAAKLALDRKRRTEREAQSLIARKAEFDQLKYRAHNCPTQHRKENGVFCTSGQITNDDKLTLLCHRCGGMWKIAVSPELRNAILAGTEINGMTPPPNDQSVV